MYHPIDILNMYKVVKGQKVVRCVPPSVKDDNLINLIGLTDSFNTKWSNIDPTLYLKCGLELWKGFSYSKFLDDRVLRRYIKCDKATKRSLPSGKEAIIKSFNFIKSKGYKTLKEYGATYTSDGNAICQPVYDYFHKHIDPITVAYMLFSSIMKPNEVEFRYIDTVISDKNVKQNVKSFTRFIKKMETELMTTKTEDKPYMDKPKSDKKQVKDQLIYGDGDTIAEKEKKKKEYKDNMLNE